jgi:hypothetical protein
MKDYMLLTDIDSQDAGKLLKTLDDVAKGRQLQGQTQKRLLTP